MMVRIQIHLMRGLGRIFLVKKMKTCVISDNYGDFIWHRKKANKKVEGDIEDGTHFSLYFARCAYLDTDHDNDYTESDYTGALRIVPLQLINRINGRCMISARGSMGASPWSLAITQSGARCSDPGQSYRSRARRSDQRAPLMAGPLIRRRKDRLGFWAAPGNHESERAYHDPRPPLKLWFAGSQRNARCSKSPRAALFFSRCLIKVGDHEYRAHRRLANYTI
jgi:hypothetical protein